MTNKQTETLEQYKRRIASAGGRARSAKLTPDERKAIARKAIRTRWAKRGIRSSKVGTEKELPVDSTC